MFVKNSTELAVSIVNNIIFNTDLFNKELGGADKWTTSRLVDIVYGVLVANEKIEKEASSSVEL